MKKLSIFDAKYKLKREMAVDVLLGLQWGDEGKGKIVDYLADQYDVVARFQGGPNAGHTIIIGDQKFVLHTIPSGIFHQNIMNLIGNGVVIDPITLMKEIRGLEALGVDVKSNLYISKKAHLILPTHRYLDAASEAAKGKDKIGSTLRGIGPTYMDKTGRNGLRIGDIFSDFQSKYEALKQKHLDLSKIYPKVDFDFESEEQRWMEAAELIKTFKVVDGEYFINKQISEGKKVLAEGAQGSMLDIDFGSYPFVTSSNTITAGVCNGLGVAPKHICKVYGISKAYCTRVGSGPFPTELFDETGEELRRLGGEFGATTGRPRRCGWIDLPLLKYTIMINGVTDLVITKMDVLNSFASFEVCTQYEIDGHLTDQAPYDLNAVDVLPKYHQIEGWNSDLAGIDIYSDLPMQFRDYIDYLSKELNVNISIVSVGPERSELYDLNV